jgi:uncharacterized membrane protein
MGQILFPPVPPYEGLHPIVVHFPIALLFIVPVFLLLAAIWKSQSRGMLLAALIVCSLGTLSAFFAVATGEATESYAHAVPHAAQTLDRHEDLAELARNLYVGVTILLAVVVIVLWRHVERIGAIARWGVVLGLLLVMAAPMLVLMNAAHAGGVLVHVHGVKAPLQSYADTPPNTEPGEHNADN